MVALPSLFYVKLRHEVILSLFAKRSSYNTCNLGHIDMYYCRTVIPENLVFRYLIAEYKLLDQILRNSKFYSIFKSSLLKFG